MIGNNDTMKSRAAVTGAQPRAAVGSDIDGLALQTQTFDFDDVSIGLRSELQGCDVTDQCIGSSILKLKDLDASKRQNPPPAVPMVTSVTTTLEKYVADFNWSASTDQKRAHVVIPVVGHQPDDQARDSAVTFSSAATLALLGTSLLGLGLAGRRSKHQARSTKSRSRFRQS